MLRLLLPQTVTQAVKQILAVRMDKGLHTCRLLSSKKFTVQDSLPHLPVPPLDQTLHKYHQSVQALLDEQELEHTSKVISKFKTKQGPHLQSLLEERAKIKDNWLSDWWRDHAYMNFRSSVIVNSNPGMLLPQQNYEGVKEQLKFAAKFVSGIIDYNIMLEERKLFPEKIGMQPLCMAQHYNVLSSCRIPGIKSDTWQNISGEFPSHIIVLSNNHFFSLNVYGKKRRPLSIEQIYQQLKIIYSKSEQAAPPLGILTTENRNEWGKIYKKLIKDKVNRASLESIQKSIFVLCLDRSIPPSVDPNERRSLMAGQILHGGGSNSNSGNRWFDKTIQIIIGPDGTCGLNFEHTSAEGPPVITLIDYVLNYCNKNEERVLPAVGTQEPIRLNFNLGPKILDAIENGKKNADSLIDDVDLTISQYILFGKDFLKSMQLSPDAFIQVALQLAYYRLYKEPCATYESASLRRFKHGRTETIRSCTVPSYLFTCAMDDSRVPAIEKLQFLRQAVQTHKNISNDAISGQGIDRHLLGLKLTAIENGMDIPKLFMDTAYTKSVHHRMTTSQIPSKFESLITSYGPTTPDGYGVCYNPQNSKIGFAVSALDTSPETCSKKMTAAIHQSLSDMHKLTSELQMAKL